MMANFFLQPLKKRSGGKPLLGYQSQLSVARPRHSLKQVPAGLISLLGRGLGTGYIARSLLYGVLLKKLCNSCGTVVSMILILL